MLISLQLGNDFHVIVLPYVAFSQRPLFLPESNVLHFLKNLKVRSILLLIFDAIPPTLQVSHCACVQVVKLDLDVVQSLVITSDLAQYEMQDVGLHLSLLALELVHHSTWFERKHIEDLTHLIHQYTVSHDKA